MTQKQLVNIVLAALVIWMVGITGVTFYYAEKHHTERMEREANKTCRNMARKVVPCSYDK